ncbi:cellulose-binding protein [Streptomyces inhibens]|uniref:cellulose-binding protein n=1 Tax=Streptomyces inhibens TaxID=2293571 RepID=UPI001EE69846|nr:cellulose-binding protein [Streptomyces inhibens]UKY50687.1 cellulose-binding protein [Streptomyces inhibens]
MSASVSPHGFETVRGRGYRPQDVDRRVEGLSIDRDSCWERAARLTVLCNEMESELVALRAYVAQQPPETFESLGAEARLILTTSESEAERLRAEAQKAAEEVRSEAVAYADRVRDAADEVACAQRTEADAWARRTEETARDEAASLVTEAAKEAEELRGEAADELARTVRHSAQLLRDQEKQQAEEGDAAARELVRLEAEMDRLVAELDARGEATVAERRRLDAEAAEAARHRQEDAEDRAAGLLAQAAVEVERIERATDRALREHQEEREEVRAHMTHVRNTLAALTGKDPMAEADDGGDPDGGQAVDPDEEDTLETQLPRRDGVARG